MAKSIEDQMYNAIVSNPTVSVDFGPNGVPRRGIWANSQAVLDLVAAHPDVLKRPYRGVTPWLNIACAIPHAPDEPDHSVGVVKTLIQLGLDVNEPEMRDGKPYKWPVEVAVAHSNMEAFQVLREHGANIKVGRLKDESELSDLIRSGDVAGIRIFLEAHPDVIKTPYGGFMPWLVIAAQERSVEMVKFLIDFGLDVNEPEMFRGKPDDWPLLTAVRKRNVEMCRLLLEKGAHPNVDRIVISAIVGFEPHSLELVKLLHQYGADLQQVFMDETVEPQQPINALSMAEAWGQDDVAEYLRAQGCVLPGKTPTKTTPATPSLDAEIIAYFNEHFGPVQRVVVTEIVPTEPRIVVHAIPPCGKHNCVTLFTTGMSDHPMNVPEGAEDFRYAEMFIQLPADWNYADIHNPKYNWPIDWLRRLAQFPYQNDTWTGGAYLVVGNGDPPQPLGQNVPFTSWLMIAESQFMSKDGRKVQLYRITPLYAEEQELEAREDIGALMRAFDSYNIPFVVDLNRPSVA